MDEYLSLAIVLKTEPRGDLDHRVTLYSQRHGKLQAKVKSSRKITSKLAAHIQPGNIIRMRVVERGGLQLVDALKQGRIALNVQELRLLEAILAEAEAEAALWKMLATDAFSWPDALRLLGWDPDHARCRICGQKPKSFRVRDQDFFCAKCASKLRFDELIYI